MIVGNLTQIHVNLKLRHIKFVMKSLHANYFLDSKLWIKQIAAGLTGTFEPEWETLAK